MSTESHLSDLPSSGGLTAVVTSSISFVSLFKSRFRSKTKGSVSIHSGRIIGFATSCTLLRSRRPEKARAHMPPLGAAAAGLSAPILKGCCLGSQTQRELIGEKVLLLPCSKQKLGACFHKRTSGRKPHRFAPADRIQKCLKFADRLV